MIMKELSSELHLYQRPLYRAADGSWHDGYWDAVRASNNRLSWDLGSILSLTSFNYVCGDSTLIKGIVRRPWLSMIDGQGRCVISEIPRHGRRWGEADEVAKNLRKLLLDEAMGICKGYKEIYILLSGGLDSRIVAGTVARLYKEGQLSCRPCAVTWGLENSRDVLYGRAVANILGLEWLYIKMEPESVLENIELTVFLGGLFSPPHLHCMSWFKNVPKDALVLAGSYGDSVGRAVYGGKHVLELDYLSVLNYFGLVRAGVCGAALEGANSELANLRQRTPSEPKYVICEHEMQGHYMRGMVAQPMSLIGNYCTLYQMFTDPNVYSYMWSIHPSLRDDRIYAHILMQMDERLVQMPWARTNRSLVNKTVGARSDLRRDFHAYPEWISGCLYEELEKCIDPDWFASTGIFDGNCIRQLSREIKSVCKGSFRPYDRWVWLAGFRKFAERCAAMGKRIELEVEGCTECPDHSCVKPQDARSWLRKILGSSEKLRNCRQGVSRYFLKRKAIKEYPPEFDKHCAAV